MRKMLYSSRKQKKKQHPPICMMNNVLLVSCFTNLSRPTGGRIDYYFLWTHAEKTHLNLATLANILFKCLNYPPLFKITFFPVALDVLSLARSVFTYSVCMCVQS